MSKYTKAIDTILAILVITGALVLVSAVFMGVSNAGVA
jgi:hypothetical protein